MPTWEKTLRDGDPLIDISTKRFIFQWAVSNLLDATLSDGGQTEALRQDVNDELRAFAMERRSHPETDPAKMPD